MQAIGCITLVRKGNQMLGVECSKGRGYILPGGKKEPDETFIECARRELREETGLEGENFRLIFQAPDGFGFWVMCFVCHVADFDIYGTGEMNAEPVTWAMLKESKYKAYYELLETAAEDWLERDTVPW